MDFSIEGGHYVTPIETAEPSLAQLQKLSGLLSALSNALDRDLRESSQWSVAEVLQDFMRTWEFLREIGLDGGRPTVTPIGCEPREMLHALREIRDFMGIYESQIGNGNAWSIRPGAHAGRVSSALFNAVSERWIVAIAASAVRQTEKPINKANPDANVDVAKAKPVPKRQQYAMDSLYKLGAFTAESRKTIKQIAIAAEGPQTDPDSYKRPVSALVKAGVAYSLRGPEGGVWLTELGKKTAEKRVST